MARKKKYKIVVWKLLLALVALLVALFIVIKVVSIPFKALFNANITGYVSSDSASVNLFDKDFNESNKIIRGEEIKINNEEVKNNNRVYYKVTSLKGNYYILKDNFNKSRESIVTEKEMYVRTYATVYKNLNSSEILGSVNKGDKLEITGYDKLLEDGTVNKYKIKYDNTDGYVYGKYLVLSEDEALKNYDEEGTYLLHTKTGDPYKIGTAKNLDFYPREKGDFEDNEMPKEVRALYLNAGVLGNIDDYIELAKNSNINAFVVDIKDNTAPGYESEVMKKYSPTSYDKAMNSFDKYKAAIQKLKDNGFYVIGRITVFKDSFLVKDHPEVALTDTTTETPFLHNGSYWPSAFNRYVWEYNVELAKEGINEMGFNEIQFDYVRFPDGTYSYEDEGLIDMQNKYNEEKAAAIQKFLMYAADEIHASGAYISADVFGESAHNYVTGYGQYWPAISNVVDVISAMPYPDHFGTYEYGFKVPVWTIPYDLLKEWGEYVVNRQKSIPTPAIVRTWIQAYDAVKSPRVAYDADMVSEEIRGLYANGLNGGYMTWNSNSSLTKYKEISSAFKKEY